MKEIIRDGASKYRATCHECGAVFTYQREDVRHNYVKGGEWVGCPSCGHDCHHFGASGTQWPCDRTPSMTMSERGWRATMSLPLPRGCLGG